MTWYVDEVLALRTSENVIYFQFSRYGVWEIRSVRNKLQFERLDKEPKINNTQRLYVDIIRHDVYQPRQHFFVYRVLVDINKTISLIVLYDGSSASANLLTVSWSLRKALRVYREFTKGLKPRYDWL